MDLDTIYDTHGKPTSGGSPFHETSMHCDIPTMYVRPKLLDRMDRQEITDTIGDAGVILYQFYLQMAAHPHPVITDELTAISLCWTERKVRRYRQALTKGGWYRQLTSRIQDGRKGMNYYVGRAAVRRLSKGENHEPTN